MDSSPVVTDALYPILVDSSTDFRLLTIHPGLQHEPIECTLESVTRAEELLYCALSYSWGSSTDPKPIAVNSKKLIVTSNCESALRHIRRSDEPVKIWVDAICIKQSNNKEKSAQIGQMRDIYKSAASVIVWLGAGDDGTPLAIDLLTQIAELGRYDPNSASSRNIGTVESWSAVEDLFRREWFQRIWVIQEVTLAKSVNIRCGHSVIDWTTFNRALQWYHEDRQHIYRGVHTTGSLFMNAMELRDQWASRNYGTAIDPPLELLLSIFSHWRATDPRDKVYALLGMSREHAVSELRPAYSQSFCQVYSNLVRYLITRDRRLDILAQCQNPPICQLLPPWVPDWTPDRPYRSQLSESYRPKGDGDILISTDGLIGIPKSLSMPDSGGYGTWQQDSMVKEEMNFSASLDLLAESCFPSASEPNPPDFVCSRGPEVKLEGTMSLKGIQVDVIDSVTIPLFRQQEDLDDPVFFLEWEKFALFKMPPGVDCPYGGSFESKLDAFWRTISTDRIYETRSNLRARPICLQLFEQWRAQLMRNAYPENAYIPETLATTGPVDIYARARVMYNAFAQVSLSDYASDSRNDTNLAEQRTSSTLVESDVSTEYEAWKSRIMQSQSPEPVPTVSPTGLREEFTLTNFERTLRIFCYARKLARTTSGRLALVPEHTRPGDRVFVLYGGSVPYIARPLPGRMKVEGHFQDEQGTYGPPGATYLTGSPMHQFVGEAYVHGIMDGEALEYPPIERVVRFRQVERRVVAGHRAGNAMTSIKPVPDPLTQVQAALVAEWRESLRKREMDVWFDHITSDML